MDKCKVKIADMEEDMLDYSKKVSDLIHRLSARHSISTKRRRTLPITSGMNSTRLMAHLGTLLWERTSAHMSFIEH